MPKVKLDNRRIKDLRCPDGKPRIELCCDEIAGFYVEVRRTSQGQGTFYLRYKDGYGKMRHVKIGRTGDVKLVDARKRAKELRSEISLGKDPKATSDKRKKVPTFSQFMEERYFPYAKEHKRTWRNDEQMYISKLKHLYGTCRLHEIKRAEVQAMHTQLRKDGLSAATCDHYAKLMRRILNLAVDWEVIDSNPLARIKLFNESNQIERYMNDDELKRLLFVLQHDENRVVANIALFLLSTGARLNEALTAKWEHIDVDHRVWRVEAGISKSKKMRAIPLNDSAINVLSSLDTKDGFEYVFINSNTGQPYACIKKAWTRMRKEAGLPKLRLHDLRHQYASLLVNSGRSLYEVQHILGHSDPKVTQRYAHLSTETLHDAVYAASARLTAAQNPPEPPKPVLTLVTSGKN